MNQLYIQTPLIESLELGARLQSRVFLKMEAMQPSGSFKNRGIGVLCSHYATEKKAKSFVSSSGGNAGLAVAYSGRRLGIPVTVVIPASSARLMIEKIRREGAEVIMHGEDWNAADTLARELANQAGAFYVPPFDHPLIWKGHATLIHEVYREGLKPDAIVVAVGGGGLFCGVAQGLQEVGWQDIPLFTAETEGAASLAKSVERRELMTLEAIRTVASSLGAKRVAKQALDYALSRPVYPQVVSDKQAVEACLRFAQQHRLLVEPACGAALSLVYERLIDDKRYKKILIVVCGGSGATPALMQEWAFKTGASI